LYDLYPHRLPNVASPFYHALHINQLKALSSIWPVPELAAAESRFERYGRSAAGRSRALAQKIAFRVVVRKRH
jgi:hypothetical protein